MDTAAVVLLVIALTVVVRLAAGMLDGDRIAAYLKQRGCKLQSRQWTPFGRGWLGEASSRIYRIEFDDKAGNRRSATVKTSLWTGVFLTDEVIVEPAPPPPGELERLREENARLRAELEQR